MSEATVIKATDPETKASAEFAYDFGDAENLIANFGADVVLKNFIAASKVQAQNIMRTYLKAGKSPEEVVQYMQENWKPGVEGRDPVVSLVNKVKNMDDESRANYVKELMEQLRKLQESGE